MEIAIPLIALGGLFIVSNQSKKSETFKIGGSNLPNVDVPNRNYPLPEDQYINTETDITTNLATVNRYDGGQVYTDKYFNPNLNSAQTMPASAAANQYKSLTGSTVDSSYFRHNNMVPFFGSHLPNQPSMNSAESTMDNYTGSGSQVFQKREVAPLFSPGENVQYAHGAPNNSDFYQSRVNPSLRMANVKPFEEIRVGPGLGLGYTAEGSGGYNSGLMQRDQWTDKNVDELRVANKQKASGLMMLGHEGPANSFIKSMGQMGKMEKNRVDTSFEMGPERYMTTTGFEKGPTMHAIPNDRFTNRPETTAEYTGAAGYGISAQHADGEYMPSKHIDLGSVPLTPAYAGGKGGGTEADYGIKSKVAYPNNRTANQNDGYFGLFSGSMGAVVAPLLDILRPSRKENTVGTLRPYQNARAPVMSSYLYNPGDKPAPTIRETTENSKFHLNVNAGQHGGAYQTNPQQPQHLQRDTTTDFYYAGGSSAGTNARQPRPYDAEYRQRNNDIKSSTIDGRMVKGNMSLMNGDINMTAKNKDGFLTNTRPVMPSMPYEAPSIQSMGKLQGTSNNLYQNIQLDRNSPDVMSALKSNPYTLDVRGGL
jgi:hypothetical protein